MLGESMEMAMVIPSLSFGGLLACLPDCCTGCESSVCLAVMSDESAGLGRGKVQRE